MVVRYMAFFFSFVLGLVFYEIRKEKGRNGEDNKDNKMNRKWKRKKGNGKRKRKNDDQKWSVFQFCIKGGRRVRKSQQNFIQNKKLHYVFVFYSF